MMEDGTTTLNAFAILVFLGLAAVAATITLLAGRSLTGKWHSWVRLYLYALLGGLLAVGILVFGIQFEQVRADDRLGSLNTIAIMLAVLFLVLMTAWPLIGIALVHRKKRIKELEKEVEELKRK